MATKRIERRLRPTSRAIGLVVVGVLLGAAAVVFGRGELLALGGFLVALPLVAYVLRLIWRPRLEAERTIYPTTLAVGDRMRVVTEVRNRSWIALEPSSYLDLLPGAEPSSVGGVLPAIGSRINRNEDKRRRRVAYGVDSMRRGVHEVGPLFFDNMDGLGLTRRVLKIGEATEVEVWPRVVDLPAMSVPSGKSGGEVEAGVAQSGDSDDVLTRDYRRGDPLRRIHWRATAHAGELRVRQEEHHAEDTSVVILDTSGAPEVEEPKAPMTIIDLMNEQAGPMTAVDAEFELAVSLAASVLARFHRFGYETELFETHAALDGDAESTRTPSEEALEGVMRRLMLTQPDAERREACAEVVDDISRVARTPVVYVHRHLTGDGLAAIRSLSSVASPALALIVSDEPVPPATLTSFTEAGWNVAVYSPTRARPFSPVLELEATA
ncbi:DUF58 domain-containing protein [Pseudoclavibacter sp. RFBA6]|uniref:DUF58 domain-containing protein n=1 Tax=Pseudoclavibacter sp. RFBA6 TaxID=2080573 RepID=UPI000CE7428C|nr:DUF58 domain-containing protein [Pseudoclavibacter sp. RFBA6]PPG41252.1 hypothetical protein C5C17_05895 [Pseudoclavibacter sp. RFBA6]